MLHTVIKMYVNFYDNVMIMECVQENGAWIITSCDVYYIYSSIWMHHHIMKKADLYAYIWNIILIKWNILLICVFLYHIPSNPTQCHCSQTSMGAKLGFGCMHFLVTLLLSPFLLQTIQCYIYINLLRTGIFP